MGLDAEHRRLVSYDVIHWPDSPWLTLSGARTPIVQAPMAGAGGVDLAVGAILGGATGSLPAALLTPKQLVEQVAELRTRTEGKGPINLNFFCHTLSPPPNDSAWRTLLRPIHAEFGVAETDSAAPLRRPFDAAMAAAVQHLRPDFVSFHFGLPAAALLQSVRESGASIIGNATTVAEGRWLADKGCDAIIAQGKEAGGHAGYFLEGHFPTPLVALLAGLREEITLPLIAAGGISDGNGVAQALSAGADAVQIGTAYLAATESLISPAHRAWLGGETPTLFTNIFTGRNARGFRNKLTDALGPMRDEAPEFPYAADGLSALRAHNAAAFGPMWAGEGARLITDNRTARDITETIAHTARAILGNNND